MRKEFESELAKKVAGKKRSSKGWVVVALCAAVLISGALAVTAVSASDQIRDKTQDKLQDGSCDTCDGDGVCDSDCTCDFDGDGVIDCDADGDGICDLCEDGTCTADCPCA